MSLMVNTWCSFKFTLWKIVVPERMKYAINDQHGARAHNWRFGKQQFEQG